LQTGIAGLELSQGDYGNQVDGPQAQGLTTCFFELLSLSNFSLGIVLLIFGTWDDAG